MSTTRDTQGPTSIPIEPEVKCGKCSNPKPCKCGRPLKFVSVDALQKQIDNYFMNLAAEHRPPTITGLALALDTTRRTLIDYQNDDEYSHTIEKAKARIENFVEEKLFDRNTPTAGAIFNLTNNYGWQNKQYSDNKTENTGTMTIVTKVPEPNGNGRA
jgi:hypothetical protein